MELLCRCTYAGAGVASSVVAEAAVALAAVSTPSTSRRQISSQLSPSSLPGCIPPKTSMPRPEGWGRADEEESTLTPAPPPYSKIGNAAVREGRS